MSSIIDEDAFNIDHYNQSHHPSDNVFGFPAIFSRSIKGEDEWILLQKKER